LEYKGNEYLKAWDLPKRLEEIRNVTKEETDATYPLDFRGQITNFPIYRVSIEMPVYRLSNGRTLARQKEYIAKHQKPDDFFSKDPESQEALDAQDEILFSLVEDKDEDLWKYFKDPKNEQKEPIILDENAYIVNGNRRICAWRRLIELDHSIYGKYEYVKVIFLHNYNESDIIKLEAQLQIEKEIKAPYTWITEALLFKQLMSDLKYDYADLERIYNKKKAEVEEIIDMVYDVDEYLGSRNWKNEYSRVEKAEFAFQQLHIYRKTFKDAQDKEIFKESVFRLLDDPNAAGDRLYKTVKNTADSLEEIKKTFIKEHKLEEKPKETVAYSKSYPLLETTIKKESSKEEQTNQKIISVLKDPKKAADVREQIIQTIELHKKIQKEGKSRNAFRNHMQAAYSHLVDAKICHNSNSDATGVTKEIENIESILKEIKGLLK